MLHVSNRRWRLRGANPHGFHRGIVLEGTLTYTKVVLCSGMPPQDSQNSGTVFVLPDCPPLKRQQPVHARRIEYARQEDLPNDPVVGYLTEECMELVESEIWKINRLNR